MRSKQIKRIRKAWDTHKRWGLSGLAARFRTNRFYLAERTKYQIWVDRDSALASSIVADDFRKPLISVILPVYNIDEKWLRLCIDSVRSQTYENWELCIADDCSTAPHIRLILEEYAGLDERIKVIFRSENGHISAASNSALEITTGEFCVLLDHDDELSVDALFYVVNEINKHPEVRMIYSDDNLIDTEGNRSQPLFKPDFSRDLMYSLNLVTHLSAYRTDLLRKIGGFRVGLEGSQDYDLALRVIERIDEKQIRHIPRILYHWRTVPGSVALDGGEKPYAHERARQAIREHLERTGVNATVEETHSNLHRVRYALPEKLPAVSVISWGGATANADLVVNDLNIERFHVPDSDNLAADLNTAFKKCSGDVVIFLRNDLVPQSESPLRELVSLALQPKIGAVGGQVIGQDGVIQAGGIVLDAGGFTTYVAHAGFPHDTPGNLLRNMLIGNFSAVCLDAFAIRKEVLVQAGPFDEELRDKDLIAADMCLRVRGKGYRITLTPYAKFVGQKNATSGRRQIPSDERDLFVSRWAEAIRSDPFSNPNLTSDGRFSIKL